MTAFITPEDPADRATREDREAADHAHALDTLARLLVTDAHLDPRDADNTVRTLDRVLNIRLTTAYGTLTAGIVVSPNPYNPDPHARHYTAITARTPWQPHNPREDGNPHATP